MQCSIIKCVQAWCFPVPGCHGHVFDKVGVWTQTLGNGDAAVRKPFNWFLNAPFLEGTLVWSGQVTFFTSTISIDCYCVLQILDLFLALFLSSPALGYSNSCAIFTDDSLLITSKLWISLKRSQYLISTACCKQCLGMAFFFSCSYAPFVSGTKFHHIYGCTHMFNL